MISPGRLWWLLRRDLRRGVFAAWHDYRTLRRITEWRPDRNIDARDVPVHLLTGAGDWLLAMWMLASWFHATHSDWPVRIHDDGTLSRDAAAHFREMFPLAEIIARSDADETMRLALAPFPHCDRYRSRHPLGLKIFDMPRLATAERFLIFDSDLLFFRKPDAIMAWVDDGRRECWFNRDVADSSLVTNDEAARLGVKLWPAVNSGLCLITREAIDLPFCERALTETKIEQGHVWRVEQTLFALCASRFGAGGLLPGEYEVSLGPTAAPGVVARHYVGAVRDRFYGEGIHRLAPVVLG
jgi:hypothetical protein